MHYFSTMHFSDSLNDISQIVSRFFDGQSFSFVDVLKKSSTIDILHNDVETIRLFEKSIYFSYFGVLERIMKFYLFYELVYHIESLDLLLQNLLYRHYKVCIKMTSEVHLSEFTFAHLWT